MKFYRTKDDKHNVYKHKANIYFGGRNADKIYYGKPVIYDKDEESGEEREHYMYPNEARIRNMSYALPYIMMLLLIIRY